MTSYHLRVLAEHGFIVEDAERGTGRDRWWRAARRTTSFTFRTQEDGPDAETLEDAEQFVRLVAEESHRRVMAFVGTLSGLPADELAAMPWTVSDWPLHLTLDEARALRSAINELVLPYRRDPANPDARPDAVRAHVDFQLTPEEP